MPLLIFHSVGRNSGETISRPRTDRLRQSGFTLIELITVIIVLGIIAAVAVPRLPNVTLFQSQFDVRQVVSSLSRLRAHAIASQCFVVADFTEGELLAFIETGDCENDLADKELTTELGFIARTTVGTLDVGLVVFTPLGEARVTDGPRTGLDLSTLESTESTYTINDTDTGRMIKIDATTGYVRWE